MTPHLICPHCRGAFCEGCWTIGWQPDAEYFQRKWEESAHQQIREVGGRAATTGYTYVRQDPPPSQEIDEEEHQWIVEQEAYLRVREAGAQAGIPY